MMMMMMNFNCQILIAAVVITLIHLCEYECAPLDPAGPAPQQIPVFIWDGKTPLGQINPVLGKAFDLNTLKHVGLYAVPEEDQKQLLHEETRDEEPLEANLIELQNGDGSQHIQKIARGNRAVD